MHPALIRISVAKRTIRASSTRHWLQTRKPIIAQSQLQSRLLRCISTETAPGHKSSGIDSEKSEFVLDEGNFFVLALCCLAFYHSFFIYLFYFSPEHEFLCICSSCSIFGLTQHVAIYKILDVDRSDVTDCLEFADV